MSRYLAIAIMISTCLNMQLHGVKHKGDKGKKKIALHDNKPIKMNGKPLDHGKVFVFRPLGGLQKKEKKGRGLAMTYKKNCGTRTYVYSQKANRVVKACTEMYALSQTIGADIARMQALCQAGLEQEADSFLVYHPSICQT